tara:strand:+ start:183 stop:647 length:465 start_codon:yes stop_codon:yes gene_type:complete
MNLSYSINHWLIRPISYDKGYYIKDVLHELLDEITYFVESTPELECEFEESTFKSKFYVFVYQRYLNQEKPYFEPYDEELYEYFSLKFSQDIINIFLRFKEITKRYNLDIFHGKHDISLDLEDFLFDHLLVEDPYYDELDPENNLENTIDEGDL